MFITAMLLAVATPAPTKDPYCEDMHQKWEAHEELTQAVYDVHQAAIVAMMPEDPKGPADFKHWANALKERDKAVLEALKHADSMLVMIKTLKCEMPARPFDITGE